MTRHMANSVTGDIIIIFKLTYNKEAPCKEPLLVDIGLLRYLHKSGSIISPIAKLRKGAPEGRRVSDATCEFQELYFLVTGQYFPNVACWIYEKAFQPCQYIFTPCVTCN